MRQPPTELINAFHSAKIMVIDILRDQFPSAIEESTIVEDAVDVAINTLAGCLALEYAKSNPMLDYNAFITPLEGFQL